MKLISVSSLRCLPFLTVWGTRRTVVATRMWCPLARRTTPTASITRCAISDDSTARLTSACRARRHLAIFNVLLSTTPPHASVRQRRHQRRRARGRLSHDQGLAQGHRARGRGHHVLTWIYQGTKAMEQFSWASLSELYEMSFVRRAQRHRRSSSLCVHCVSLLLLLRLLTLHKDEIDALASLRTSSNTERGSVHEGVLTCLLNEMDGVQELTESLSSPRRIGPMLLRIPFPYEFHNLVDGRCVPTVLYLIPSLYVTCRSDGGVLQR